jgi:hypothetical protein
MAPKGQEANRPSPKLSSARIGSNRPVARRDNGVASNHTGFTSITGAVSGMCMMVQPRIHQRTMQLHAQRHCSPYPCAVFVGTSNMRDPWGLTAGVIGAAISMGVAWKPAAANLIPACTPLLSPQFALKHSCLGVATVSAIDTWGTTGVEGVVPPKGASSPVSCGTACVWEGEVSMGLLPGSAFFGEAPMVMFEPKTVLHGR